MLAVVASELHMLQKLAWVSEFGVLPVLPIQHLSWLKVIYDLLCAIGLVTARLSRSRGVSPRWRLLAAYGRVPPNLKGPLGKREYPTLTLFLKQA